MQKFATYFEYQFKDTDFDAMENAGFSPYPYEWWHFDIGNIFWSRVTKRPEIFGPLFSDKEWPNAVIRDQNLEGSQKNV